MASDRQLVANRANALRSTGPRSLAGKARSSMNAVQHGLTGKHPTLPGEDPKQFEELLQATRNYLQPQGPIEKQLVEHLVSLIWRQRRIPAFEHALLEWTALYQARRHDGAVDHGTTDLRNYPEEVDPIPDLQDMHKMGRAFEALLTADVTGKLSRYELSIQRQIDATLKNLRELKAARTNPSLDIRAEDCVPPVDDDDKWVIYEGRKIPRLAPP